MSRWIAAVFVLFSGLVSGVLAQKSPVDQGVLAAGTPLTGTLLPNEPHTYGLTLPDDEPLTILTVPQSGAVLYAYLLDNTAHLHEPISRTFRDGSLTQVYSLCRVPPCRLVLEGEGGYTVSLLVGNLLDVAEAALHPGDIVDGTLANGQETVYEVDADANRLITLTLTADRQPVFARLTDSDGNIRQPIFTHYDGIQNVRAQVYAITHDSAQIFVYGAGKYTLQIEADDTIRVDGGALKPGEEYRDSRPATGYAVFELDDLENNAVSVMYGDGAREVFLQDATGQRIFADTTFIVPGTFDRTIVFTPSGEAPYQLTVQAENSYFVTLLDGDASYVDAGLLKPYTVTALDTAPGMNPVFTVASLDRSTVMTLIFGERTTFIGYDSQFRASDGSPIVPVTVTQLADGLRLEGFPDAACPCPFIPRISGRFAVSLAGELAAPTLPVTLVQSEVNLRAGANTRAPVIAIGGKDQALRAFARSNDNQWLLALTEENLVVWVFRSLTNTPGDLDTLPVIDAPEEQEVVETAEATAEVTTEATPLPTTETPPATPPPGTATPSGLTVIPVTIAPETVEIFDCMITSGGGVNMRSGAGVEYAIAGSLTDGATTRVVAQSYDTDGNIWWQLENSSWVRADVVVEIGNCNRTPAEKPPGSR